MNDSLPLDPGFLEIDKKTKSPARGAQIIDTLRRVFVGETLGAFQFDNQNIFHENIGKAFPNAITLVSYWKRGFGRSPDSRRKLTR